MESGEFPGEVLVIHFIRTNKGEKKMEEMKLKKTEEVYCRHCGAKILEGTKFCGKCGEPINKYCQRPNGFQHTSPSPVKKKGNGMAVCGGLMAAVGLILFLVANTKMESAKYHGSSFANAIFSGSSSYSTEIDTMATVGIIMLIMGVIFFIEGIARTKPQTK